LINHALDLGAIVFHRTKGLARCLRWLVTNFGVDLSNLAIEFRADFL